MSASNIIDSSTIQEQLKNWMIVLYNVWTITKINAATSDFIWQFKILHLGAFFKIISWLFLIIHIDCSTLDQAQHNKEQDVAIVSTETLPDSLAPFCSFFLFKFSNHTFSLAWGEV